MCLCTKTLHFYADDSQLFSANRISVRATATDAVRRTNADLESLQMFLEFMEEH